MNIQNINDEMERITQEYNIRKQQSQTMLPDNNEYLKLKDTINEMMKEKETIGKKINSFYLDNSAYVNPNPTDFRIMIENSNKTNIKSQQSQSQPYHPQQQPFNEKATDCRDFVNSKLDTYFFHNQDASTYKPNILATANTDYRFGASSSRGKDYKNDANERLNGFSPLGRTVYAPSTNTHLEPHTQPSRHDYKDTNNSRLHNLEPLSSPKPIQSLYTNTNNTNNDKKI